MQPDRFATARNWLGGARDDVTLALELSGRMPNVACFHAQQAAEKALKAWLVALSGDVAREHLMQNLLSELSGLGVDVNSAFREDALALGKFYVTTRYPDALGGADPRTAFVTAEADEAARRATRILDMAAAAIEREQAHEQG